MEKREMKRIHHSRKDCYGSWEDAIKASIPSAYVFMNWFFSICIFARSLFWYKFYPPGAVSMIGDVVGAALRFVPGIG